MPTEYETEVPSSALDHLEASYSKQSEPTERGMTHAPGTYTGIIKNLDIHEGTSHKAGIEGRVFTFVEVEFEVVQPANTAREGELPNGRTAFGNSLRWNGGLNAESGQKAFKAFARSLGVKTESLKGDIAGIRELEGRMFELTVKHKESNGKMYQNLYIKREVTG